MRRREPPLAAPDRDDRRVIASEAQRVCDAAVAIDARVGEHRVADGARDAAVRMDVQAEVQGSADRPRDGELRSALEAGTSVTEITESWDESISTFVDRRKKYLLYE